MRPDYAAHTPPDDDPERWHDLKEHLFAVANAAAGFAASFGAEKLASAAGLTHDLAKADSRFQEYLTACHENRHAEKCPHAHPSAKAAYDQLGPVALTVLGHHTGMPDKCEAKACFDNADEAAVASAREFMKRVGTLPDLKHALPTWATDPITCEMLLRMVFSALVDADFLDTEKHFDGSKSERRGLYPAIADYQAKLNAHLTGFANSASTVSQVRAEVLASCYSAATQSPGVFKLSVPTGGGKTLSGLAFALDHADARKLERVIVAIPYTSIIDQTAKVYADIFGAEAILEHHSSVETVDDENGQTERESNRRLASENWDCPLIVTTTVQLFESLLANKPSRCRKLHNIAQSVIVLDEVQTLPPHTLAPILDVLRELVEHYGCSVVFCTATQPDYSGVDSRIVSQAVEIVPEYPRHFAELKRVRYEIAPGEWPVEYVAERIDNENQVLTVLNTRKDALAIALACRQDDSLYHLSTLVCGHHRKRVVREVKHNLKMGAPVRLVSTQVVEAGVDVDFPIVMRDLGPLDRIIQVAGRCNREGLLNELGQLGTCIVFRLQGRGSPRGAYRTFTELTITLLEEFMENLDDPAAMQRYFREAFKFTSTGNHIQELRKEFKYRTVAEEFKLIADVTKPLVVLNYSEADVPNLLEGWGHMPPGKWFRRLSPFTVSVYDHDIRKLRNEGLLQDHESGALIYTGAYDARFGLTQGLPDPADLIV